MLINFVVTKDLGSRIFFEIFKRFADSELPMQVVVSEEPVRDADIYHYHRVHLEIEIRHPAVMTVHHDPLDVDVWLEGESFYEHYRNAATVICLNSLQQAKLADHGVTRTTVIPHGFDNRVFTAKKPLRKFSRSEKITLGFTSRRYERRFKGEVLLQELAERIDPARYRFLFVGEGREVEAALVRRLGFEARSFEFMPYRLFPRVYDEMDFLLMISNFEGGPANLPEAVASGTPMLSTPVGMAVDLVRDGENGILLSGRVDDDAELFERLAANTGGIYNSLMAGAQKLNTAITWDDVIRRHFDLYSVVSDKELSTV